MDNTKQLSAGPTVNQMRARMTNTHRDALRNLSQGRPADVGRVAYNTLLRWGAISNGSLTEIGKALLPSANTTTKE